MCGKLGLRIGIAGLGVVLALGSVANGLLSLDIRTQDMAVGERLSVTVWSDTVDPYTAYLELRAEALGRWSGPMFIYSLAGTDAWAEDLANDGQPGWWRLEAASENPEQPIMAGPHFQIDYYASELRPGIAEVVLRDSDGGIIQILDITQDLPEPCTAVALLALGAVALTRRRSASCAYR